MKLYSCRSFFFDGFKFNGFRVDSVMSNNPEVAQIESQKIRTLRLFVNTITFDEFVGSGLKCFSSSRKNLRHQNPKASNLKSIKL